MSGHYQLWHDLFLWSQSREMELHAVSSPQNHTVRRLVGVVCGDIQLSSLWALGVRLSSEGFPGAHAGRNSGARC